MSKALWMTPRWSAWVIGKKKLKCHLKCILKIIKLNKLKNKFKKLIRWLRNHVDKEIFLSKDEFSLEMLTLYILYVLYNVYYIWMIYTFQINVFESWDYSSFSENAMQKDQ